jgi:hypothetical protein
LLLPIAFITKIEKEITAGDTKLQTSFGSATKIPENPLNKLPMFFY